MMPVAPRIVNDVSYLETLEGEYGCSAHCK